MTRNIVKTVVLTAAAFIIVSMFSCTNPAGPLSAAPVPPPPTGIEADESAGLTAGLDLEGDAILANPDVQISDGVEWVPGLSGNAMRTDSDGEFLRIVNDALSSHTAAGSVEVWVFPEGTNYYTGIVHKGEMIDFSDEAWSLQFHADRKPYFYFVSESGSPVSLMASEQIPLNTWSHLAATWKYDETSGETVMNLYVNGYSAVSETRTGIGPVKSSDGDVLIGSQLPDPYDSTYGHLTFTGMIDEVALYNVERSAAEVEAAWLMFAP